MRWKTGVQEFDRGETRAGMEVVGLGRVDSPEDRLQM